METKDISILNRVRDCVCMKLVLKQILGGAKRSDIFFNLFYSCVGLENWRTGESKELRIGEELADSSVIFAKLRPMTFVEDEDHSLIAKLL